MIFWWLTPVAPHHVSIPQAVSTVVIIEGGIKVEVSDEHVSIPQAVSTVVISGSRKPVFMRFQKLVLENLKP